MIHKSGCIVCGNELIYTNQDENLNCYYCRNNVLSNVKCTEGHYVCDRCHSMSAIDLIQDYCISTELKNPLTIANNLMKHPAIKMHGPEHHFLVPAVLLAAYYNQTGNYQDKKTKIVEARKRAEKILGGFCGSHGNCGAAVGAGIFMSLITNANPLSTKEWQSSNMATANSLSVIAQHGGPRCCKRNSFLAISTVINNFDCLEISGDNDIKCEFSSFNKECRKGQCPFFMPTD